MSFFAPPVAAQESQLTPTVTATSEETANNTTEKPQLAVMIVNQVRGEECCDPGSLSVFLNQVETASNLELPAHFALRYDALSNPTWRSAIKKAAATHKNIKFGLFLEVTPTLAETAGVTYRGGESNWYQAQNAFFIGYEPEDRKKLAKTLFSAWGSVFTEKPSLTSAWMVDTATLEWINQEYGVTIHQITREQWGVDSYTLHGGPPHYPYKAGKGWLFRPATSPQDELGVWVVRQTVTDPLMNYGDTSSAFTSQPNDYSRDGKTIEYYRKLVDQAAKQQLQPGFILLGLENSMGQDYQTAYTEQLKWLVNQCKNEYICYHLDLDSSIKSYFDRPITVYCGTDEITNNNSGGVEEGCWITTPKYRVRLRRSNTAVAITDFRIFDAGLSDPYNGYIAQNQGYWVIPGILDAAVWPGETAKRPLLHRWLGPPEVARLLEPPKKDTLLPPTRLDLPQADQANQPFHFYPNSEDKNSIFLEYSGTKMLFNPHNVEITSHSKNSPNVPTLNLALAESVPLTLNKRGSSFTLAWKNPAGDITHELKQTCSTTSERSICIWYPTLHPELFHPLRQEQYAWWLPESLPRALSKEHTNLYAHNRYAIAGRNPVRLVLKPGDHQGFPTTLSQAPTLIASPEVAYTAQNKASEKEMNETTIFIDLIHNAPQKSAVTVTLSPELTLTTNVYFAPNCKQDWKYCATHPVQTWWWLNTVIRDKMRAIILKEQQ